MTWVQETGWTNSYEIDSANRSVVLVGQDDERVGYGFNGKMRAVNALSVLSPGEGQRQRQHRRVQSQRNVMANLALDVREMARPPSSTASQLQSGADQHRTTQLRHVFHVINSLEK